jgi:AcrR family transcriptional regulator
MLSEKQQEREQKILAKAQIIMATHSRGALTIGKLAIALRMAPSTIRFHFADSDAILGEILLRHLTDIAKVLGKIPPEAPNRKAAARTAYIEATRTGWGGLTEPHLLLVRERHTLPEDLARPVEDLRQLIGELLAGDQGGRALHMLDEPDMQVAHVEAALAVDDPKPPPAKPAEPQPQAKAQAQSQAQAGPQPTPKPVHKPHYRDWKAARLQKKLLARKARAGPAI